MACGASCPVIGRRAFGWTGCRPSVGSGQGTSWGGHETLVALMLPLPAHIDGPLAWRRRRRRGWRGRRRRTGHLDVPAAWQCVGQAPPYTPVDQKAAAAAVLGTESAWVAV